MVFRNPKDALAWSAAVIAGSLALNLALVAVALTACVLSPGRTMAEGCDRAEHWMNHNAAWIIPVSVTVFGPFRQIFRSP
jgi:hypothetical protein